MKWLRWVFSIALFSAALILFVLPRLDLRAPGYVMLTCWLVLSVVAILFASRWFGARGDTKPMRTDNPFCVYCKQPMRVAYLMAEGGVWVHEDRSWLESFMKGDLDALPEQREQVLHCLIDRRGYRAGNWPIEACYCHHCRAVLFQTRDLYSEDADER